MLPCVICDGDVAEREQYNAAERAERKLQTRDKVLAVSRKTEKLECVISNWVWIRSKGRTTRIATPS